MSYRPIKTKCFRKWLESINCNYNRTKASHEHWKCPDCWRTVTFQGKHKEIPPLHIQTLAKTIGVNVNDIYTWIENNC